MAQHLSFPSIEQFRTVIKQVRDTANHHSIPVPTLTFQGTVKLHGCVSGKTLVTLADGSREKISELTADTSILTFNLKSGDFDFSKINEIIVQELVKDWVNLVFDNGIELDCTVDHPILTTEGWVTAGDLTDMHEIIHDAINTPCLIRGDIHGTNDYS
jgi:hypothetical protein